MPRMHHHHSTRRRIKHHLDPRNVRPDVCAGIVLFPMTLFLCTRWGIRPNQDAASYFWVGVLLFLLAALPTVFLFVVGRKLLNRKSKILPARVNIVAILANLLFLVLMSWIYTHIKAGVLMTDRIFDPYLQQLDRALCNGHDPIVLARYWIPSIFARPLAAVYMAFFPVLLGCIIWLALEGKQERSDDMTCSVILAYYIGVLMYHLMPSLGPAYSIANSLAPGVNDSLVDVQNDLLAQVTEVRNHPGFAHIVPWRYIAAFPSLHVTGVLIAIWYMRYSRLAYWALNCFGVLTAIGTVYFGWHYLADWVGGLAVAGLAIWITSRFRLASNIRRRLSAIVDSHGLPHGTLPSQNAQLRLTTRSRMRTDSPGQQPESK